MKKRVVSLLLCLIMALSLIPTTAFAVGTSSQDDGISLTSIVKPDGQSYYTYEFYLSSDSSEPYSTQIVKEGEKLYQPETPTTEVGKVFTGWYDETGNLFDDFGKVDTIAENKTIKLTAKIEDGYYVYFKDNTGRIIATKTGKTGDKITFEKVSFAVGTDEAITGWYTDKDCTSGNQVEYVTIKDSNITLYAKVETGYWLTFESNGGSYVAPAFYANGTVALVPTAPTKPGYTFDGWYTDEALETSASFGGITTSTTLYAKWTAANKTNYTVIHWQENVDDDKFSFMDSETMTGTTGELTKAAAKSCDGFNVRGIEQKTIAGDGSTIVNVFYERNEYTINFWPTNGSTLKCHKEEHTHSWWKGCYNLWGKLTCTREEHTHDSSCYKTGALFTITAKYGANISNQWPARSNSSTNWSTKKDGGSPYQAGIDVMPLGGGNFYVPNSESGSSASASYYVEVLEGEDGIPVNGRKYKLHHTDTVMMRNPSITWDEDFYDITGFTRNEIDSTQNRSRYNGAKFYYYRNSYKIKFINGSNVENTVSKQYEADISDVSYTPTTAPTGKEGYRFVAWYDNELCEGTPYVFTGKMPAKNITVYAKWVAPTYTVKVYDQNNELRRELNVSQGETVIGKMPAVTVGEDETFLGWVQDSPNGNPFTLTTEIHRDYSLYAKVGSTAKYTVTYDGNGGTGSVTDSEKYGKGAFATVKANDFTKDNMVFLGWNTKADGTGTTYYPNSTVEITDNVTLYAIWGDKDSTVTLTYKANYEGADPATNTINSIKNNAKVTLEQFTELFPARDGYRFTGWNTQADGSGTSFAAGSNARVDVDNDGDNVLYAQWKRQTGTLIINKVVEGVTLDANKTFQFQLYTINDTKLVTYDTVEVTVKAGKTSGSTTVSVPTDMYFVQEIATSAAIENYSVTTAYERVDGPIPVLGDVDIDGTAAVVTESGNTTVKVTNRYNQITGTLTISKELVGLNATDFNKPFSFTVWKGTTEIETFDLWTGHSHSLQLAPGKYTIVENNANVDGYKLTTSFAPDYNVEVKAGANTAVVATNTYEKITGTVTINKVLKGLNATDFEDGFAFDIKDASGKVVATVEEVFPGMTQPATVTLVPGAYTIVEKSADVKDYDLTTEYDKETFTVEAGKNVTVTVTNTYTKKVTPPPAEYTLSVDIQKNIELKRSSSRKPGKASFTFEAYLVDEKGNETILDTVTIDTKGTKSADGTLTFTLTEDDLSVTGHGTVYVREVKGSTRGWTYDDTVYALGVELLDGKLNIISVDTKRIDKPATLSFINTYYKRSGGGGGGDKPIQSVKTGDMGIAMYAMTSLLSLGGAALVIKKRKEEK